MTKNEFQAWFAGFSESIVDVPTANQWARIKAVVSEINDIPTVYPVFVDRYVAPYKPWYQGPVWSNNTSAIPVAGGFKENSYELLASMKAAGRAAFMSGLHA